MSTPKPSRLPPPAPAAGRPAITAASPMTCTRWRRSSPGCARLSRAPLKAFLLRNGYRYTGKSAWTEAHRRYLRELVLNHPAQKVVLEDALNAISTAGERIERLEDQMSALLTSWHNKPVVEALMG